jgi:hypothetical protein
MPSSGVLCHVAPVKNDVSEELNASIIRVTRIGEECISSQCASVASYGYVPSSPILVTQMIEVLSSSETSVLTSSLRISLQHASPASYGYVPSSPILVTLMMEALSSSKTLVLTIATRRNIPEDAILQNNTLCGNHICPSIFWLVSVLNLQTDTFNQTD